MTEEVELKRGITPRVVVLTVILTPLIAFLTLYPWELSSRPYTFSGQFISYFWIILFFEVLGRINPRLRLSKQEMVILMVMFWLTAGISFIEKGTPNEGLVKQWSNGQGLLPAVYAMNNDPYMTNWKGFFPDFWTPQDPAVVVKAWTGGPLDWGPWIAPIIYWSLIWLAWVVPALCWGFMFKRPLVEIERLPFVAGIPLAVFSDRALDVDPSTNKSRIFDLSDPGNKLIWIGVFIGMIGGLVPLLTEIFPALPIGAWWGEIPINLTQYIEPALPGFDAGMVLHTTQIPLWLFVPTDVLLTSIVSWLAFNVIYNIVVLRMGLVPFEPGISNNSSWSFGWQPPFHYAWFAFTGILVGVGLWTFWGARDHLKKVFSTVTGPDFSEGGQSMRQVVLLNAVFTIFFIGLWVAGGIPLHLMIIFVILWVIWQVGSTRMVGEVWYHMPTAQFLEWPYMWNIGVATGQWADATPTTSPAAVKTMFMTSNMTSWTPRFASNSMFMSSIGYRVADITKTRAGEMFRWLLVVSILGIFTLVPAGVWFTHRFGGLSSFTGSNGEAGGTVWETGNFNTIAPEWVPSGYTILTHVTYTVVGAIVAILMYVARARFPWFFLNPSALAISMWLNEYMWFNAIAAFILKMLVLRVGGVTVLEKRVLPFIVGFATGYGSLLLISAFRVISLEVIPLAT